MESANRALSILERKPLLFSSAFSSSMLKMPVRRPVPINVPMVSNVSERLNAKIVIITSSRLEGSANSVPIPAGPNAAPNVVPSWENELPSVPAVMEALEKSVTPNGMPTTVVAMMPIRMAPRTFAISSTTISTMPNSASRTEGVFSGTMAGTAPEEATTVLSFSIW